MTLTYIQGEDLVVAVPLTRDGEPFLADAGSVVWSLRDHAGVIDPAYKDQPLDAADTTLLVPVPAAANAITNGRQFEKRTVVVKGLTEGQPFVAFTQYRVIPWLNHSVTPDLVRSFIGTDVSELKDADIDLPAAYFDLETFIGATALAEALDSGTIREQRANDAIKGVAVLRCLPGLRQRLLKRAEDGIIKGERFNIDFAALATDAQKLVTVAVTELSETELNPVVPTLFVLTTPSTELFPGG